MKPFPAASLVLAFAVTGCGPPNLDECRAEAAKLPTDMGVRIAVIDCQKKFGFDPSTAKLVPFNGKLDTAPGQE